MVQTQKYALTNAEKQIKNYNKRSVTKALRSKLVTFLYRSYQTLRKYYELLRKRYKKVKFPQLEDCKRQGDLYVAGAFTVWY